MRATKEEREERKRLSRFLGKFIRAAYPAPAITCESNGHIVRMEGKVARIARMRFSGRLGLVLEGDDRVVYRSDVECLSLHWVGSAYKRRVYDE